MADSTMSDADKIRMKRLAKLGGSTGASSLSPANNNPASESTQPPVQPSATSPPVQQQPSPKPQSPAAQASNPFQQLGMKSEPEKKPVQIKVRPRPASPAKRESDGAERSRPKPKEPESLEVWQDRNLRSIFKVTLKPEEVNDSYGHKLTFLGSTRQDLVDAGKPIQLSVEDLEGAITEAATHAPDNKPFEYLLTCFKQVSKALRNGRFAGDEDAKRDMLKETRRLCMSYCVFAVTMPEMFGDNVPDTNPLVDHLLAEPECDYGICTDFLDEADRRLDGDEGEMIKTALVQGVEAISQQLSKLDMLADSRPYITALRSLLRYKKIASALTDSEIFLPEVEAQDIETKSLLGPFFRLSPMQIEVAKNYFPNPKTPNRSTIAQQQNAVRLTLRTHQDELFAIADALARAGGAPRERLLNWFALCVNKNHKKRAMRVDYKVVSSDGFMVNVTNALDRLFEPAMDAQFGKIDRIDVNYLRRNPRVDIREETKINADQRAADDFYAQPAKGTNNFISEIFFLAVAAHHYGTEAAQERVSTLKKTIKRWEQDLIAQEAERHKFVNQPRYLEQFERYVQRTKDAINQEWCRVHATQGVLLDDLSQARSMQFMRYVIVWLLRLASQRDLPKTQLQLPLPEQQADVFRCLPEYFLEDIVDNFKFITSNIPHIITQQQADELVQVCITFLRNTEYVKNPGVKHGLVTILFYGVQPMNHSSRGLLGDLLLGSPFAHKHLLHALMRFYIEAESTGTHTQFYDKFNIRFEIFQVIKCIWANTMYRENLSKEAKINTNFFVQFVNMITNDSTFVLDESLSAFAKIHELTREVHSPEFNTLTEEQRKEKQELLEDAKGKAKSYMQLTNESMETLKLFTETLPDAFTMPEIVQRLAAMLDYNLDILVGTNRANLRVENKEEYKFSPTALLQDIAQVYLHLSAKQNFIEAIANDGRSYKAENFSEAHRLMNTKAYMAPEELQTWKELSEKIAGAVASRAQEEEDLGEPPDEFTDQLMAELMKDPVILPSSKAVMDRSTIRSHLLSDPTDPFNRMPLKIEDVIPDDALRGKIEAWRNERLAAVRAEKAAKAGGAEAMDTSQG